MGALKEHDSGRLYTEKMLSKILSIFDSGLMLAELDQLGFQNFL